MKEPLHVGAIGTDGEPCVLVAMYNDEKTRVMAYLRLGLDETEKVVTDWRDAVAAARAYASGGPAQEGARILVAARPTTDDAAIFVGRDERGVREIEERMIRWHSVATLCELMASASAAISEARRLWRAHIQAPGEP